MIAALADFWPWPGAVSTPAPRPRTQPLLLGDILTARGGEPDFLIRWREDSDALGRDAKR
jgi:hypothetical protein